MPLKQTSFPFWVRMSDFSNTTLEHIYTRHNVNNFEDLGQKTVGENISNGATQLESDEENKDEILLIDPDDGNESEIVCSQQTPSGSRQFKTTDRPASAETEIIASGYGYGSGSTTEEETSDSEST